MKNKTNHSENQLQEIQRGYLDQAAVELLSNWYVEGKETSFIDFIFKKISLPFAEKIVEIGGGAGMQGLIFKRMFGDRYLHTDYSEALVAKALEIGLNSQVVDGLAMPFDDESIDLLILVGTTTLIRDEATRKQQITECARVLRKDGYVILISARLAFLKSQHCLNSKDVAFAQSLKLDKQQLFNWGLIPGRFWKKWNRLIFKQFEGIFSKLGFGLRRVVILKK